MDPTNLPEPIFTSAAKWNVQRIHGVAIYCSDGRWGEAFDEFCHRRLQLPRYDRFALPGGPACLIPRDDNREAVRSIWQQLDFLVRAHDLKRIVLITHFGCVYYGDMLGQPADACLETQLAELDTAKQALHDWFPGLKIEPYLGMRHEGTITFHPGAGKREE